MSDALKIITDDTEHAQPSQKPQQLNGLYEEYLSASSTYLNTIQSLEERSPRTRAFRILGLSQAADEHVRRNVARAAGEMGIPTFKV